MTLAACAILLAPVLLSSPGAAEQGDIHHSEQQVHVNESGHLDWALQMRSTPSSAIATEPDGGVITGQSFSGQITVGEGDHAKTVEAGGPDAVNTYLAKFNEDGALNWIRQVSSEGAAESKAIARGEDGSLWVSGDYGTSATWKNDKADVVMEIKNQHYWGTMFLAKYGSDGTLGWVKAIGGGCACNAVGEKLASTGDAVLVSGTYNGKAVFGEGEIEETEIGESGSGIRQGIFLARYEKEGNLAWAKASGWDGNAGAGGVVALPGGASVVAGDFVYDLLLGAGETNEITLDAPNSRDGFIARYNPNGTLAWVRQIPCTGQLTVEGLAGLPDRSVVMVGHFDKQATFGKDEDSETALESAGPWNGFVARFMMNGELIFAMRLPSGLSRASGVAAMGNGTFLVTGRFLGNVVLGEGTKREVEFESVPCGYPEDAFVARLAGDGSVIWAVREGGAYWVEDPGLGYYEGDWGAAVAASPDGSAAYATGLFRQEATFGEGEAHETTFSNDDYGMYLMRVEP
jgi:hypothetical protein